MRAVFLDFSGTLMDEDSDHEAHTQLMAQVGRRFFLEETAHELVGEYHVLSADLLAEETSGGRPAAPNLERLYTRTFIEMLSRRGFSAAPADETWFHDQYHEQHRLHVRLYPEAVSTLEELSRLGLHVGLISDFDPDFMDYHLRFLGIEARFDSVTTSGEAGCVKPGRAIFALALKKAGAAPEEAVMVGNSLERDVDGALEAGMNAILIDRHNARITDTPKLKSLKGLPKLLRRHFS